MVIAILILQNVSWRPNFSTESLPMINKKYFIVIKFILGAPGGSGGMIPSSFIFLIFFFKFKSLSYFIEAKN